MKAMTNLANPWRTVSWAAIILLLLFCLFVNLATTAPALGSDAPTATYSATRFATPLSSPVHNGGSAQWTVKKMTFQSQYPNGFTFFLDASSSAGDITIAKVFWRHATGSPVSISMPNTNQGQFTVQWLPNAYQRLPQWVGVDYWWQLIDSHGNVFETPHGYAEYADNTRKWKRLVSEDAVIVWEATLPAEIGPAIAKALEEQRTRYYQAWGKLLDYKPHIIIYGSFKPWAEWEPNINERSVEGETSPYWGGTVQIYRPGRKDSLKELADGVILHEVEHLYQQTFNTYKTYLKQVWFYEGDASYFELYTFYDYLQAVRDMAAAHKLPRLQQEPALAVENRLSYDIGYSYWKYIEATFGPDMHRKIWDQIRKGVPIEDALRLATGKTFAQLEDSFDAWLVAPAVTATP